MYPGGIVSTMNSYDELLAAFSEVLEKSEDYHIAHVYHVGYVSIVGLIGNENGSTMKVVDIFRTPVQMAESLLRNWRWQWLYRNRGNVLSMDYNDIKELDRNISDNVKEAYEFELHKWKDIVMKILKGVH